MSILYYLKMTVQSYHTPTMKVSVFQSVDHVEDVLAYFIMHHTMQADSHCLCKSDLPKNYDLYVHLLVNTNFEVLSNTVS